MSNLFSLIPKFSKAKLSFKIVRRTKFLKDVFGKKLNQKVLISYLSNAFIQGVSEKHTSLLECYSAAKVFDELGYTVDVVDFDDQDVKINYSNYNIIYGFGFPFEKSFRNKLFSGHRILYSTGCNSNFTNSSTTSRLKDFYLKSGIKDPELIRTVDNSWPLQKYLSDAIISLGNKFVADTYRNDGVSCKVFELDLFYPQSEVKGLINNNSYDQIKNNLIWFGSKSCVHKGLDIAIELAEKIPNLTLHICGYEKQNEYELYRFYEQQFNNKNIIDHGFVNIHSPFFAELINNCGAAIFPSVAEGGAGALLTLMGNSGIIPITTRNVGLDLDSIGFISKEVSVSALEEQVKKYLQTPNSILESKRKQLKHEIQTKHNHERYKETIKKIVIEITS
ncbi:MAG: glycosyltransferase [Bacteroidia bacterium]|nr:glycosyltransferase [Bacteroidia bacterium]